VYRAKDSRLNREVAIKVSDSQFSERFEREAEAIAALNHPHICQIYDIGPNYLVMEFIEGTRLQGPFSLDRALRYAVQIRDALNAAHKKSITHRDLKPGNILVTTSGVKLLDFGLAKISYRLCFVCFRYRRTNHGPHGSGYGLGHCGFHVARTSQGRADGRAPTSSPSAWC
jgi:serine/threonine protein kinase